MNLKLYHPSWMTRDLVHNGYILKKIGGKIPKHNEDSMIRCDKLIKLVSGGIVKLSELFLNKGYEELENNSICVKNTDFSDTLEILEGRHLEFEV